MGLKNIKRTEIRSSLAYYTVAGTGCVENKQTSYIDSRTIRPYSYTPLL